MTSQATSKATPCRIPEGFWRSAAKLHEARCGMGSRSSHISGVIGRILSHQSPDRYELSKVLASTKCCPLAVSSAPPQPLQDSSEPGRPCRGSAAQPLADGPEDREKNLVSHPPNRDTVTRKEVTPFTSRTCEAQPSNQQGNTVPNPGGILAIFG